MSVAHQLTLYTNIDGDHLGWPVASWAPTSTPVVQVGAERFPTTVVFDTYWRFAARRQAMYEARISRAPGPWTADPILRTHRFTNCYRAADRVSQYLIREVAYRGDQDPAEVVFRILLFKLFNRISTWELLVRELGRAPSWAQFDLDTYDRVLTKASAQGERLYSAAYVIPPPQLGAQRKHTNHLRLVTMMMSSHLAAELQFCPSMREAFHLLRRFPAMGDFLAYQFLIDLNYSEVLNFAESDFVVAGPGARDGIRKCFGAAAAGREREIIAYMADHQEEHFQRLGLSFGGLRGRRLQLIDAQNLFCEVDKYARVAHPDIAGISGRTKIKQKFAAVSQPVTAWFPPKWGLNDPEMAHVGSR